MRLDGLFLSLVVALCLSGCFFTAEIKDPADAVFYSGICDCEVCTNPPPPDPENPPTEFCLDQPELDSIDIMVCEFTDTDPAVIFTKLSEACIEREAEFFQPPLQDVRCSLNDEVNIGGMGFERFFVRGTEMDVCGDEDFATPYTLGRSIGNASTATFNSSVVVDSPDLSGTFEVFGDAVFSGGNCVTGACPITLHTLELRNPEFDVTISGDTKTASDGFVTNTTTGTGTCSGGAPAFDACFFLFDVGTLEIVISAELDGERKALTATNVNQGGGIVNFESREVTVTQSFTAGDTTVQFFLEGAVDNLAPLVRLPDPQAVACGVDLSIAAEISDVDGNLGDVSTRWFVDGALVAQDVDTLVESFAPGPHTITVVATDSDGAFSKATTTVDVAEDVTPPMIVVDPVGLCIWPPNHDYVVFTADDVAPVVVVDDCDPDPSVIFSNASSSQPDNGLGDGNTDNDIVVKEESICARRERQGGDDAGRRYEFLVEAVDASGNRSDQAVAGVVHVPHDQSPDNRCSVSGGTPAEADDPRCVPSEPGGGGCNTADSRGHFGVVGLIALLLFGRRRRRVS